MLLGQYIGQCSKSLHLSLIVSLFLPYGCTLNSAIIHTDQDWSAFRRGVPINKMAVLPIEPQTRSQEQQQAAELLTLLLFDSFSDVPRSQLDQALARTERGPLKEKALSLGILVGAHAVLYGKLDRFEEGGANGKQAHKPASVAFQLYVLDVNSGDLMWWARYDETQRSPRGDELFMPAIFVRNARWWTAEELATQAVKRLKWDFTQAMYIAQTWWDKDGNGTP